LVVTATSRENSGGRRSSRFVGNAGVNGGVAGGPEYQPKALFYVGVPDVEEALARAERLGGHRLFGPDGVPGKLVVGQFTDPEGNLIGVAGTA
jgi:predicted enzyme related to lactoylglutathione lyase